MPVMLSGSCRCGAVRFSVESHTPHPYQLCYCSICRKTAGGGGYAINLMGDFATLSVTGKTSLGIYQVETEQSDGHCEKSTAERHFCVKCASALWLYDPTWPELIHPFASAVDIPLPRPPERVHLMLAYKPEWVEPQVGPYDRCFDEYPEESIEEWHRSRGLWVD